MSILEILTTLWGVLVSVALVYNKLFGKMSLGDDTLFSLDNRYDEKILQAIHVERERGEKRLAQKLQDAEEESNRKLKAQADEHNQAYEALEARASALQEKVYQLINKVNDYLEGIVTLERLNSDSQIKIMRLESTARRNKEALEAAKDAATLSDTALKKERTDRKANEEALTRRIDALQEDLQKSQKIISESELEKARLKGMIEGVSFQQEKERQKTTDKTPQN